MNNLGIGILWICVGAAAGWFASKIMGTNARSSALANISIGILAALVAGFVTRSLLGVDLGYASLVVGVGGALLGSCLVIFGSQVLLRRKTEL